MVGHMVLSHFLRNPVRVSGFGSDLLAIQWSVQLHAWAVYGIVRNRPILRTLKEVFKKETTMYRAVFNWFSIAINFLTSFFIIVAKYYRVLNRFFLMIFLSRIFFILVLLNKGNIDIWQVTMNLSLWNWSSYKMY
jgi:hypothetical protein